MKPSELFLFTGRCLAMDGHPAIREEVAAMILADEIPWEEFIWLTSSHYILPALFSSFERNAILPLLPEELADYMNQIYTRNLTRNQGIATQCREVVNLLAPRGIKPLFLKGAGFLLAELFPERGDRLMEDVDILIQEGDIEKTMELLISGGYLFHDMKESRDLYLTHHHLPPIYHPHQVATLEIHRHPVKERYRSILPESLSWQNGSLISSSGIEMHVPSVQQSLLLVFIQELQMTRSYLSSYGTLKGIFDFYLLSTKEKAAAWMDESRSGREGESIMVPDIQGRYRRRFLRFMYGVRKITGDTLVFPFPETKALKRYWRRQLWLMDHPLIEGFWFKWIYTPFFLLQLLVTTPFSIRSRQLMKIKIKKRLFPGGQ